MDPRPSVGTLSGTLLCCAALTNCRPTSAPPCPTGYEKQPERRDRIAAQLREAGEALPAQDSLSRLCFGDNEESSLTTDGWMLLNRRQDDRDLAARVVHLLRHQQQGNPLDLTPGAASCEERVAKAREREVEARESEERIRLRLGRPPLPAEELERVLEGYALRCRQILGP